MAGLDETELARQTGEALPAREQLSLLGSGGGLGAGLVDTGTVDPSSGSGDGLLGSTDASGSTDPEATTTAGDGLSSSATTYPTEVPASTPTSDDGAYSPNESAVATDD